MKIEDIIQLLNNRLNTFKLSRDYARMSGDLERVNVADVEISGIEDTLFKLNLLVGAGETAVAKDTSVADVINSNSTDLLKEYDISSYATDPLHEEKIIEILSSMGEMGTVADIDAYIKGKYADSPLTGAIILNASNAYSIPTRLMMAIMELDSRFGTVGVAVKTLNPGNVGNDDDGNLRTYGSWQEGVTAVAEWLSRHKKTVNKNPVVVTPPFVPILTSISITPNSVSIITGATQQLTVNPLDQNGNNIIEGITTFESDNLSVATVNNQGMITTLSAGTATITIKATLNEQTVTGNSILTVNDLVIVPVLTSISITPNSVSIITGATQQLTAYPLDQNGNNIIDAEVTFESDNPSVATVDGKGMITTITAGTATITYKASLNGQTVTGSSVITVSNPVVIPALTSITVIPIGTSVIAGTTHQITANPLDQNGNLLADAEVTFESDNPSVATVDGKGMITTITAGTTTITYKATLNGQIVTGNSVINVTNPE